MKKFFSLLLALATIGSASASVILHESFDGYEADAALSAGRSDASTNDRTHWYDFSGSGADITIAEGSLSYAGYVSEGKGSKAKLAGNGLRDLRQFNAVSTGKVYAAAIINAEALKANTTAGQFLALGDASNSGLFAKLYVRSVKDGDDFVGYNLGISKSNESYYRWSSETLLAGKDYLVVLEYEFVDGTQNDITRLYINPTAEDQTPTLECVQDSTSASGAQNGAKGRADANYIASINLSKNTNNPNPLYVDEIKVATEWADLFEGGETPSEPSITVQDNFAFETDYVYLTGDTYTGTLHISGENLTNDITLSSSTSDITFEKTTITAAEAAAEGGVAITATLIPSDIAEDNYIDLREATITLTSGDITKTIDIATYYVYNLTRCENIAALQTAIANIPEDYLLHVRLTGNAVVTYIYNDVYSVVYTLEDATGAITLDDQSEALTTADIALGDELTNILSYAIDNQSLLSTPTPTTVVSHNKETAPQEVTLATLLADTEDKYLNRLVVVKNVLFDDTDVLLASGNTPITQGETVAYINLPSGNPLINTAKPNKAVDITGVWAAGSFGTKYLRPRTAADIVDHTTTGIEEATFEAGAEIYTIQGMRVESLQPGVNIIRKGNTIYKVVR